MVGHNLKVRRGKRRRGSGESHNILQGNTLMMGRPPAEPFKGSINFKKHQAGNQAPSTRVDQTITRQ